MKPKAKWFPIEGRFNIAAIQYNDYLLIAGTLKAGTILQLVGEPSNKYDNLAISIRHKGIKLGYVPRFSVHQSELWRLHKLGCKCVAVLTAHNKTNPTWCMFTVQLKRTEYKKERTMNEEIKF